MAHYVLDARTATPHFPGIGRYVASLARALAPVLADDERLTLLVDSTHPLSLDDEPKVSTLPVAVTPFAVSQQWVVPRLLRDLKADLYHSPYYLMPYRTGVPTVLTVYDLIPILFPRYSTARARLLFRWFSALALRSADLAIAISESTQRDFARTFRVESDAVVAIPLAAAPTFRPQPEERQSALRRRYGLPDDFLLYLGSNKPHKNLFRLIEAYAAAEAQEAMPPLVIAGAWYPRYPEARERAEALRLEESVQWLGPIPEEDLPALYASATAFVFASLYEGFGLPPLEAMACGTPVTCSEVSSLREVVGDAALLFDPVDVESIAQSVAQISRDEALRRTLRTQGLARAQRFSWGRTAVDTLQEYRKIAYENPSHL